MNAPNAPLANLQGPVTQALAALSGNTRTRAAGAAAETAESGEPVEFASLLKSQWPADSEFDALQEVKAALHVASTEESPSGVGTVTDIAALLAEISQPLAPTAIPLAVFAVAASAVSSAFDRSAVAASDTSDARTLARNATEALPATILAAREGADADNAGEFAGAFAGRDDSPADSGTGAKPVFRLPETSPLAAAHALSQASYVAGPTLAASTASHANLVAQQPIHSPQWSSEVGHGLVWMARNDVQTAQMLINPPQLGPVEITLSLGKDQASVHFSSPYADVREILQQALPRLREILEGAGVQLGQADVSAQSQQPWQQPGRDGRRGDVPDFGTEHATLPGADAVNEAALVRTRRGLGLVDTFA